LSYCDSATVVSAFVQHRIIDLTLLNTIHKLLNIEHKMRELIITFYKKLGLIKADMVALPKVKVTEHNHLKGLIKLYMRKRLNIDTHCGFLDIEANIKMSTHGRWALSIHNMDLLLPSGRMSVIVISSHCVH